MEDNGEEDDDNLYDDIMKDLRPAAARHNHPPSLTTRLEELEQLTERLQKENAILKRNMGTLYRTAVAEIQRKERSIRELREKLAQHSTLTQRGS